MAYRAEIEIGVRGTEKLRELRNTIDDISKRVNKLDELANTFQAPIQSVLNYTKAVQQATAALDKAELGSRDEAEAVQAAARAITQENTARQRKLFLLDTEIRKQQGILRAAPTSGTIELGPGGPGFSGGFSAAQRQAANEQAILRIRQEENKLRRENLSIAQREEIFELKLRNIRERNLALENQRSSRREATSNAIIGGAFPLLFGQGIGASVGGAAGGFAGGLAGGQLGFGLSLVGTAVGASFDALSQSSVDFAKSLRQGGDAATYLENTLGYLDPTLKKQLQNLQNSGQTAAAADLAFQELARTVGKDGAEAFLQLGKNTEAGTLSLKRIAASFIAAGLASNKFFNDIKFGKGKDSTQFLPEQFRPTPIPAAERETAASRQRTAELSKNNDILRLQVQLTSISARNDLDKFVTLQKQIATKEYENELTKISIQLKNGEITAEQRKLQITAANLDLSKKLGDIERSRVEEVVRRQQQSAQAAEEAQRKAEAILRAQLTAQKSIADERLKNLDIIIEESKFNEGEETALRRSLQLTEARGKLIQEALSVERETALQEAAKNNTTQQTVKLYDQKLKNAQNELNLQTAITERQLDQLQIQRELDKFQRQRRLEQDLAGLQLPGNVSPLEQLTRTQAGRREQLLGPRFEELDLLQTRLAARTGTFTDDQIKEYRNRLVEVNNEIGRLTDGLAQVDAAEITWERNKAGAEALQNVLNGLGSTVTDVFSSLITNTNDFNSSLSNALRSLSNLLLQATISGLAGTDGVGFFSFLAGGLGRRAAGGPVANRTPYIVGERGPELFVPNSSGSIVPNNQLSGMGGDVSVVVNVDANGSQVQGNENQAKALGGAISAAVQAEIVKQQRPGGLLAGTR